MKQDFRTNLNKARGLGSAKEGTHHFWLQRLTALANIPLVIFLIGLIVMLVGKDYATVISWLANPLVALLMAALVISGIWHMKLGMQVIIEDYIPSHILRSLVLAANSFFCFLVAGALIIALLKIVLNSFMVS